MSDATIPAVVQDAQRYDWREDLDSIEACEEVSECADGCCTFFTPRHNDECIRLAAYIERLEDEIKRSHDAILALTGTVGRLEAERDALLAAVTAAYFLLNSDQCTHGDGDWHDPACRVCNLRSALDALPPDVRDQLASMTYTERVIHGE